MEASSHTEPVQRYLVRHGESKTAVAIVEASSSAQANERARLLQQRGLLDGDGAMVSSELDIWLPLPHFQDGYFAVLERRKKR